MEAGESSQGVSGLLLAGARAGGIEILVRSLSSRPYVVLTREVAAAFGMEIDEPSAGRFVAQGRPPRPPASFRVEADASAAAFLLGAAAITSGRVRVQGVSPGSPQGDAACLALLESMGCVTRSGPDWMEASGPLRSGIEADFNATPDLVPPFAAVALYAPSSSRLTGIAHLRLKESDRIAALAAEATRLGARVETGEGELVFHPAPLTGTAVLAHGDHRIAMAMAIVALRLAGMSLDDPACVAKSYPGFFGDLERLIASATAQ
jgi:3-phosphoshikimate 1-carboxyvinyltransferase